MKACIRFRFRVLGFAWWLLLLLPALAFLMGWEAAAALKPYALRGAVPDPRSALALVLDVRHFFPLAGAAWSALWLGMDWDARGLTLPLSRGYGRGQVFWSKYLIFLAGCVLVSLMEQVFAVLKAVRDWQTLPAAFLLRCLLIRLVLDVGMMALPSFLPIWGRESVYPRLLGLVYGVALWRLMRSHYFLWLQYAEWRIGDLWALWPLAGLAAGILLAWALSRREADGG